MHQHRILLVPSDDLGWVDLRRTLIELRQANVVGEATATSQTLHLARTMPAEVVLAAAAVDGEPTYPILSRIRDVCSPPPRIVVFATRSNQIDVLALNELGITDFLLWSELSVQVLNPLLTTIFISNTAVASKVLLEARFAAMALGEPMSSGAANAVSDRERAVLRHLAAGLSDKEIALELVCDVRTIERMVADLKLRFEVASLFALGVKVASAELLD